MSALDEELRARLAAILTRGFDAALDGMTIVAAADGHARVRLPVSDKVQNIGGALHGGAAATLVDVAGTIAIISADRTHRVGVTTDLNVSYFAPGRGAVIADATVLKSGRTLAWVSVDVRREDDGVLVAQGRMTKHLGA
jgi:acyl-coenzyme A thioesterase 13